MGRRDISASGGAPRRLRLWDLGTGQTIHPLQGHTGPVNAVRFRGMRFSPSERLLGAEHIYETLVSLFDRRARNTREPEDI